MWASTGATWPQTYVPRDRMHQADPSACEIAVVVVRQPSDGVADPLVRSAEGEEWLSVLAGVVRWRSLWSELGWYFMAIVLAEG